MAQYISKGDIFGRIGTGIGKGMADQLPEEITRGRLSAGLKNLGDQKNLSPFQQFAALSAIPGITPQMIQSGTDLLRQEARGKALADFQSKENQPKPSPFAHTSPMQQGNEGKISPSITKEKPLAEIQKGYIPPTKEEEFARAGQLYNEAPQRFGNDPQKALDFVASETDRNQAINQAYQQQHGNLSNIQDNVVSRLKAQSDRLNANVEVPAELYSRIEDEAIQATKSKKDGGQGLTEQQAMKKYGDKLNDAARDFSKIDEIGDWGITLRPAKASLTALNNLQNKMEKLGETDNFAKRMISKNKLSPILSYAIAEPVSKIPSLNNTIKSLPALEGIESLKGTGINKVSLSDSIDKTLKVAPILAKFVKDHENASPLAIAYELQKKGYDPQTWLEYVTNNSQNLNLRQRQSEQASTPLNIISPWNDWWLESFSGIK